MSKCINCSKNVESVGTKPKKYCSDVCRMQFNRNARQTNKRTSEIQTNTSKRTELHPAIIAGIERLTTNSDGTVDQQARTIRMAAAKRYQRLYSDKPYTGMGIAPSDIPTDPIPVRVSKPGDADYVPLCEFTRQWCQEHGY